MLKIEEIRELIELINDSTIDEFSYEHDGAKIKLKKNTNVMQTIDQPVQYVPTPQVSVQATGGTTQQVAPNDQKEAPATANDEDLHTITSPMVGTFYQSSSPEEAPYVTLGAKVEKNSIVCIVEAMKLFNEIEAEVDGEIVEILVNNGQLVEFGQPLFVVKPR